MRRLAWFTPLPPVRSGVSAYSAEILPLLAADYLIDLYVDEPTVCHTAPRSVLSPISVFPSHEFVWRHANRAYDLVVYQLGNATCHDYMWAYLARYPGLVVLHDAQVHQARAKGLLKHDRPDDYREEFRYNHPDAPAGLADLVVTGLGGTLYYFWPLLRVIVRTARLTAVHSRWLAEDLRERFPGAAVEAIRMGVGQEQVVGVRGVRSRHSIPADSLLFAAYGVIAPEKRITPALRALAAVVPYAPNAHLMLVGERTEYYDPMAEARAFGVADRVTITGYVADEELPAYLAAADVCLCLRWPTARETSASWLRCLAAGKPTVVTELVHTSIVPALDPRSWTVLTGAAPEPETDGTGTGHETLSSEQPVCVAVDIVDEQHSLILAMRRLATDAGLRDELGRNAHEYWKREHTLGRMAADYRRVIDAALVREAPRVPDLPSHFRDDGMKLARRLAAEMRVEVDFLGPWDIAPDL